MRRGFSLVELSIVLVILGLLVGGILAGQSLIRAAELRSITTDLQRFHTAMYTFRDKYFQWPGDMTNATAVWGIAGGTTGNDVTCQDVASTDARTCNGNGDGMIETNMVAFSERFRVWQHLANAGLIEGRFTGRDGSTVNGNGADANFNRVGINVPKARVKDAYYVMGYMPSTSGDANWFDMPGGWNHIALQAWSSNPLIPEEAWNIDTKLDDGRPGLGGSYAVKSTSSWAPGCATTAVASTALYALSSTARLCPLFYAIR